MEPNAQKPRPVARLATLAVAIALGFGASEFIAHPREASAGVGAPVVAAPPASTPTATGAPHFADLIERVRPAVVNIAATRNAGALRLRGGRAVGPGGRPRAPDDPQLEEMFRHFFGGVPEAGVAPRAQSAGSGFLIDGEGWIVTNRHVIADADEITVTLQDGRHFPASVKGADEKTDLALLKIAAGAPLPAVDFGDAARARIGDWVIAIGNPFGLGGTATAGIISARGRDIHSGPYDDYLQIDAPINQGNSGGPVFDDQGRVIGVNTAIYSPNGGSVGIGFAIPASTVREVVDQLKTRGSVQRGWLGVQIQPVTDDIADGLGLDAARGALVAEVEKGSPAAAAGLQPGDVVTRFGDTPVAEVRDLTRAVASANDGDRVEIEVHRDGRTQRLSARPRTQDDGATAQAAPAGSGGLGLTLAPLDDGEGARVVEVRPGSPAADEGLAADDVIRQAGGRAVRVPGDVQHAVDAARQAGRHRVVLLVDREGERSFHAVPIG